MNVARLKKNLLTGIFYAAALFSVGAIVFPIYWLITMSFKTELQIYELPPDFFPMPKLDNYFAAFRTRPLGQYIWNSVFVTTFTTIISVTIGALAGFGFSRFSFPGARYVMLAMLATRMIPPITLVFPLFLIMRNIGLLDTYWALILAYTTFNVPFATFLMYGFFQAVPRELDEAAMMDGCSRFRAFFSVILPTVKPGLVATSIMCMLLAWKDFLWALRFTYSEASQTIPIGITTYMTSIGAQWGPMTAVAVLSILPLLIFSFFVQKHMIRGLMGGAIKG